ncbi:MAG: tetratricopeptide repeat protein [Magnetococcales bacterium]|nr:tetratricopeptide repeat protein [Magnetococcales bacterium]
MSDAWWRKGVEHHRRGEYREAEACYARIARGSAMYHAVLGNRGLLAMQRREYGAALALLDEALRLRPDFVDARINRGMALTELGRLEEAEESLREALRRQPEDARALGNLGVVLKRLGRFVEAGECFERVLAVHPGHVESWSNLANLHKEAGRMERALECYRRALALRPDHVEVMVNCGMALGEAGRNEEAEVWLRRALAMRPEHGMAALHLGQALQELGRFGEAEDCYRRSVAHLPDSPLAHRRLGDMQRRGGRAGEALVSYRRALMLDPEDGEDVRFALAAMGEGGVPERANEARMRQIYGRRARYWDGIDEKSYLGAGHVAAALRERVAGGEVILDAGCGTGMVGGLLRDVAARLDGVDLSGEMVERARAKGIYDRLEVGDLVAFLDGHPEAYDAVVSAATFIHFGDLFIVLSSCLRALRSGGCLVFTVFTHEADLEGDGVVIHPLEGFERGGCYAHGRGHVTGAVEAVGLRQVSVCRQIHEYGADQQPVWCWVVVASKP